MRMELVGLMRLYNIQRGKLEYAQAQKQKKLFAARNKSLKSDLNKAWKELSDPFRGAQPAGAPPQPHAANKEDKKILQEEDEDQLVLETVLGFFMGALVASSGGSAGDVVPRMIF